MSNISFPGFWVIEHSILHMDMVALFLVWFEIIYSVPYVKMFSFLPIPTLLPTHETEKTERAQKSCILY